jgi:hypothetical protein
MSGVGPAVPEALPEAVRRGIEEALEFALRNPRPSRSRLAVVLARLATTAAPMTEATS